MRKRSVVRSCTRTQRIVEFVRLIDENSFAPTARPQPLHVSSTGFPQQRRLIRTRDLRAYQRAIVSLAIEGSALDARRRAVIVPTRAAITLLRETIETEAFGPSTSLRPGRRDVLVLPELLTRDEWMSRLHDAIPAAPLLLTRMEREILFEAAATRSATRAGFTAAPFEIRPGLVSEMLTLYDELQRRQRSVGRFRRALFEELGVERGTDRGSEQLLHQTTFLTFTFLAYERAVAASGKMDEHQLRRRLLLAPPVLPFNHVIVAVADHPADPRGLWPADFDLLGRLSGFARVDVLMTDPAHDEGLRARLEEQLPGIEEHRPPDAVVPDALPTLVVPNEADASCFVSRDREEEMRDVARAIRRRTENTASRRLASTAIVFRRPLPYLYVAPPVLNEAGVPFDTLDALPLAAEPRAALIDLVLSVARTGGTRESIVALLRSPHLGFDVDGTPVTPSDAGSLDGVLRERRAAGDAGTYAEEVRRHFTGRGSRHDAEAAHARRAAVAAAAIGAALAPYRTATSASEQVATIATFVRRHERRDATPAVWRDRDRRARAAVLSLLDGLAHALAQYGDTPRTSEALTALIHHALDQHTFVPDRRQGGVLLVDAVAARFGAFDHVHFVGLVEADWPERPRRSIFYASGLLSPLGWPGDRDQMRAEHAAFHDLLGLARNTLQMHAFQFEGETPATVSPMVDEAAALPRETISTTPYRRLFSDERLTMSTPRVASTESAAGAWLALRSSRPGLDDRRYRGFTAPQAPQPYKISKVDRYVDCPFKYFSETVLGLPEDREESAGLTPLERGTIIHKLFEQFYKTWQAEGQGTITPATLPRAVELFGRLTREELAHMSAADRTLEETRLLGSIVGRGIAERVFELESDLGDKIVHRLLEIDLRGPFVFPQMGGFKQKTIEIRGKADRVDVFANGSLRVVDYKLSKLPDLDLAVQIGVYAHCVKQMLEAQDRKPHPVTAAMYLAFGDDRKLEAKFTGDTTKVDMTVGTRAEAFANVTDQIESGAFPPKPVRPGDCQWCRYAGVCRKEYAVEDDEAAESV